MKLALSTLCENPSRRTGLTTLFHEFVSHSLAADPSLSWLVFADRRDEWPAHPRLTVRRWFPAAPLPLRLAADHTLVPLAARLLGADALVTVGFAPLVAALPVAMHVLVFAPAGEAPSTRSRYRRWALHHGLRSASLVIANSNYARERIEQMQPSCRDRLLLSAEGLQHDVFHPNPAPGEDDALRRRFGLDPGYLLWVSNLYPYKQPELLLHAYARLPRELRLRTPLVIAGGSWGTGVDRLAALSFDLGIEAEVRILGWVEDQWLPALYRQARAFVLSSREETFGRCVLEAMACGCVAVLNNIPVLREVTAGHAVFADFRDPGGAARALSSGLFDESLRARLRARALQHAGRFSFERLAAERISAIAAALRSPAAAQPSRTPTS